MRVGIIGATGLVGSRLAPLLDKHELLVLTRRPSGLGAREKIAPAAEWPSLLKGERIDVAISTLGTTWRKAGSWDSFEKVDRTAVVSFARAVRQSGARQMILVSSVGADAGSANRYLSLKGKVEADLATIGFERLDLVRPGLLRGPRGGDRRLGERLGIFVSPLANVFLRGRFERFAAVDATQVAAAIAALVAADAPGRFIHHNREILQLARA